jgi:hypothetical protein
MNMARLDVKADRQFVADYVHELIRVSHIYAHIEPTNACNTTCLVCPRDAMVRPPRLMRWDIFEAVMAQILPTPMPMISFVGFGEPTLHKRLSAMIRYVRDRRPEMIIKLTSNGILLTDALLSQLYASGLDLIELSVMGASPSEYERLMGGIEFATVMQVIESLNRGDYRYRVVTFPNSDASAKALSEFWTNQGARHVQVKGLHRRGGYLAGLKELQVDQAASLGTYNPRLEPIDRTRSDSCHKLYLFLHINAEGSIVPCVQEINSKNIIAQAGGPESYSQIFQTTRAQRPTFDICQGCELIRQDLLDHYISFFETEFPERVPKLRRILLNG